VDEPIGEVCALVIEQRLLDDFRLLSVAQPVEPDYQLEPLEDDLLLDSAIDLGVSVAEALRGSHGPHDRLDLIELLHLREDFEEADQLHQRVQTLVVELDRKRVDVALDQRESRNQPQQLLAVVVEGYNQTGVVKRQQRLPA